MAYYNISKKTINYPHILCIDCNMKQDKYRLIYFEYEFDTAE